MSERNHDPTTYNGILITRDAQERSTTFAQAASFLHSRGLICGSDPRLQPFVISQEAVVATTLKAFGAQVTSLNDATKSLDLDKNIDRKIRSLLGVQKKIFGDDPHKINPSGPKAAQASTCMENIAMQLPGTKHVLASNLLSFAATTSDRCVYADRHKGFDGLVSPLANRHQTSISNMAKELVRAGKIPLDDPRAQDQPHSDATSSNLMTTPFLDFIKSSVVNSLSKAKSIGNPVFGRKAIINDVVNLKLLPEQSNKPGASDKRAQDFMMTISRINERMAMNAHLTGARPQTVQAMLDTSDSASRRAMVYQVRAEMDQYRTSVVGREGRKSDSRN